MEKLDVAFEELHEFGNINRILSLNFIKDVSQIDLNITGTYMDDVFCEFKNRILEYWEITGQKFKSVKMNGNPLELFPSVPEFMPEFHLTKREDLPNYGNPRIKTIWKKWFVKKMVELKLKNPIPASFNSEPLTDKALYNFLSKLFQGKDYFSGRARESLKQENLYLIRQKDQTIKKIDSLGCDCSDAEFAEIFQTENGWIFYYLPLYQIFWFSKNETMMIPLFAEEWEKSFDSLICEFEKLADRNANKKSSSSSEKKTESILQMMNVTNTTRGWILSVENFEIPDTTEESLLKYQKEKIQKTAMKWFFDQPVLFRVYMTHNLSENREIDLPFRSGKMRLEYNPYKVYELTKEELEEALKTEVTRIALLHPYDRLPDNLDPQVAWLASNITITQKGLYAYNQLPGKSFEYYYRQLLKMKEESKKEEPQTQTPPPPSDNPSGDAGNGGQPSNSDLSGRTGENKSSENNNEGSLSDSNSQSEANSENTTTGDTDSKKDGKSDSNEQPECGSESSTTSHSDQAQRVEESQEKGKATENSSDDLWNSLPSDGGELWDEDPASSQEIQKSVEEGLQMQSQDERTWGDIPERLQQELQPESKPVNKLNLALHSFRNSVISKKYSYTRTKPNRRYGWLQMGKHKRMEPKFLIGVDTSASVDDNEIQRFYAEIAAVFKKGSENLDVIQFDCQLKSDKAESWTKKSGRKKTRVTGRGGTDFNCILDFFIDNQAKYSGLLIFSDGYAGEPHPKKKINPAQILWIFTDKKCWDTNACTLGKYGKTTYLNT